MKKLKWLLGLCLMALVVCGSGGSVQADSSSHVTDDGIEYVTYSDKDEVIIAAYNGTNETVIIPSEINGKPVTYVRGKFFDTKVIKHCTIPEGVYGIGSDKQWMYRKPTSIESVSLPSTLKTIGDGVFAECCNLSNVTLPDGLTSIGVGAFAKCSGLNITIPDSVTTITEYIFGNTVNVTIYANSNSYARTYAHYWGIKFSCLGAHDWDKGAITTQPTAINDGIKTYTCTACKIIKTEKVAKLGLPKKGNPISEPNSNNTYKVTKSASKNGTVEFAKVSKSTNNITIPDTVSVNGVTYKVTSISKNAFKNNKRLKKVTIGKNITKINANTFYGCKNLKTITIKSTSLKSVGKNAFKGINAKAKIKVPKSKLGYYKKLFAKKGQKNTVKIVK